MKFSTSHRASGRPKRKRGIWGRGAVLLRGIRTVSPAEVERLLDRRIRFGILAESESVVDRVEEFLSPEARLSPRDDCLRIATEADFSKVDVGFSEPGLPHPAHFYSLRPPDCAASAKDLLKDHDERLWVPLAARFPGFRRLASERLIRKTAEQNTLLTVSTALPNIVPSALVLPWAIGEFATDTTVLTANQVRLSFLLAAAHDRSVGLDRQAPQIASIVAGAFGWRALARQAVSKIPAGTGLAAKGLVSFAGTYAVGRALEYWFREGRRLSRAAQREFYRQAKIRGKNAVSRIAERAIPAPAATAAEA